MSMRVFGAVAQLGNFSAAAQKLGISRAMASRFINDLEESLDARLLNRTTRKLSLTEIGHDYYERISHILVDIDEAEQAVSAKQLSPAGTLKMITPPSFGSFHLSRAISDYMEQYCDINIEMFLSERAPDLIEEGVDLAIRIGQQSDSSNIARKLTSSRMVVCCSPGYLDKHHAPETPDDLNDHNCMTIERILPFSDWKFNIGGDEVVMPVNGNFKANLADPLRIAAINGRGLVQLPSYIVGLDIKAGRLIPLLQQYEPESLPIYIAYAHRRFLSAKVKTFVEFLQDYFHPPVYWDECV